MLGAGDAVIGINPATDNPERAHALLSMLDEIRAKLDIPTQTCVLAHITTTLNLMRRGSPARHVRNVRGRRSTPRPKAQLPPRYGAISLFWEQSRCKPLFCLNYFCLDLRTSSNLGGRHWSLPKQLIGLVHVVAANWSLGTQLKAPEPDHPYTFFGAKTAATFIQLNADLL